MDQTGSSAHPIPNPRAASGDFPGDKERNRTARQSRLCKRQGREHVELSLQTLHTPSCLLQGQKFSVKNKTLCKGITSYKRVQL